MQEIQLIGYRTRYTKESTRFTRYELLAADKAKIFLAGCKGLYDDIHKVQTVINYTNMEVCIQIDSW